MTGMKFKAEMGTYSSTVGQSVHLIAPEGHFAGQVALLCQDDRLRDKDTQAVLLGVICKAINAAEATSPERAETAWQGVQAASNNVIDGLMAELDDARTALEKSESFLTGFEDDLTQQEVGEYLKLIRATLARRKALIPMPHAWGDVIAERRRQISAEGWTHEHDDEHDKCEMAVAAACYIVSAAEQGGADAPAPDAWPWAAEWWKLKDHRSNLVRAAALTIAEIERLDRADAAQQGGRGDGIH